MRSRRRVRVTVSVRLAFVAALLGLLAAPVEPVRAQEGYDRISGEGSSWAANFIDAVRVNVQQFGITVDYNPSGSTSGRKNFLNGTVDFAASDIPFQFAPEDGSAPENPAPGSYAYMPVVAGGTAFMYNLMINGQRVTNLRLSGENIAKIFSGVLTQWNDPAIAADNPGLTLPARAIVPVVRSDGSGSSAQFTKWMIDRHPQIWQDFCERSGRAPACGFTSQYPTVQGMIAQSGDLGIAGYVSQSFAEGAIGYVNYSYALGVEFPVAKVLNAAGYYTEPTPQNVAVSLLQARINMDGSNPATYLTQQLEGVYADQDPRNYQLSSYSYFILPTKVAGQFNEGKGRTLGAFTYYAMCQAQQQSAALGYSPMPINLVQASFEQILKIPGVEPQNINIQSCNNPTFSPDGSNRLADNAPMPQACDQQGSDQCPDGTGGMRNVPTATARPAGGGGGGGQGGGGQGGGGQGGGSDDAGGQSDSGGGAGAQSDGTQGSGGQTGGGQTSGGQTGGATTGGDSGQTGGAATATTIPCPTTTTSTIPTPATTVATTTTTTVDAAATPSSSTTTVPPTSTTTTVPCVPGTTTGGTGTGAIGDSSNTEDLAAGVDPASSSDDAACDPDTGICVGAAADPASGQAASGGEAASAGGAVGAITPTTLDRQSASVVVVVLVILLTLGLVLVPAFAWRYFSEDPT